MSDIAIKIENLKKQYKLGAIGGQTLNAELRSWWARKRGKEDPNLKIGQDYSKFGERFYALDGINLEVKKGEALGIIGGNGAGKSTLLKILSRVTAPTEGDIWIDGRIASMLEVGTGFHPELTGRENIYMNGAILGMTKKEVDEKIESIIDFSECRQFIDTPVKRYSSGMYVKLAFAVASHLDAEIMIMDEVLAVGDVKFQKKCLGKMGDEAKSGRTVLYVSHNMATIRALCTRCIVLQKGKMIFDGNVEDAINVYMESNMSDMYTHYDFKNFVRHSKDLATKVMIDDVELLNKTTPCYLTSETISMKIKWHSDVSLSNVKLGFSLKNIDRSNVGFATMINSIPTQSNSSYDDIFEIDLSILAAGKYYIFLNIYEQDELGGLHSLDQPSGILIELIESGEKKLIWQKEYWGSVRLPAIVRKG